MGALMARLRAASEEHKAQHNRGAPEPQARAARARHPRRGQARPQGIERRQGPRAARRTRAQRLTDDAVEWPYAMPCCKKLRCCEDYEPGQVRVIRQTYLDLPHRGQKRKFLNHRMLQENGGGSKKDLFLESPDNIEPGTPLKFAPATTPGSTRKVCSTYFRWSTSCSTNKIAQPLKQTSVFGTDRKPFHREKETASDGVVRWVTRLGECFQVDPTSDLVLLPFRDREQVFEMYGEDYRQAMLGSDWDWLDSYCPTKKLCSSKYFKGVWNNESTATKRVKLRKWLKFAKCDTCVGFREQYKEETSPAARTEIKRKERLHYEFVKEERRSYWTRRDWGRNPGTRADNLSLIIDAADQAAYASPYFYERTHASQAAWKLPMHLIACISHGRKTFGYTFLENVKHGNNLTLEVLFRVLVDTIKCEGRLPPNLYLQLDNTTKQCKGQYILGFMALLVQVGIFEKIVISFLPVGHTHEDIDQIFSRLAIHLRKHNARNQFELLDCLKAAYTPRHGHQVQTEHMTTVANFSDWIHDFMNEMGEGRGPAGGVDGITNFRQFKFFMHQGKSVMQVRANTAPSEHDEKFQGLHQYITFHDVFKHPVPMMWDADIPDAQRRPALDPDTMKAFRTGNAAMVAARAIPPEVNGPLLACIDLVCSPAPIPFHWVRCMVFIYFACLFVMIVHNSLLFVLRMWRR
jgi:hypothetical protein